MLESYLCQHYPVVPLQISFLSIFLHLIKIDTGFYRYSLCIFQSCKQFPVLPKMKLCFSSLSYNSQSFAMISDRREKRQRQQRCHYVTVNHKSIFKIVYCCCLLCPLSTMTVISSSRVSVGRNLSDGNNDVPSGQKSEAPLLSYISSIFGVCF